MAISDCWNRVNRGIFGSDWNSVGEIGGIRASEMPHFLKPGIFGKSVGSEIRGFSENWGFIRNRRLIGGGSAEPQNILFEWAFGRQN